jgi:uridylate kinase
MAQKIKFKPGQHFVIDQHASKLIKENKITSYIISETKELNNILKGKNFIGTILN